MKDIDILLESRNTNNNMTRKPHDIDMNTDASCHKLVKNGRLSFKCPVQEAIVIIAVVLRVAGKALLLKIRGSEL